jgi:uncharacterized protein
VYENVDQSWVGRPKVISEETVRQVSRQLASYAAAQELGSVSVILHGGEPLLAGPERIRFICEELTRTLQPVSTLDLRIHTNGVQLSPQYLRIFDDFGVRVGISLDGDQAANDRHRLDRRGRSSYQRVLRAVKLLHTAEFRHLDLGLLCTVDVANDPVAVHDALTALDPPRIDYLLPHATWEHPPPGPSGLAAPYGDWLLRVFDRWEQQGRKVPVRTFESVLSTLRGGPSLTEALGLAPCDLAVVETDGSFELVDSLKTAYEGAPATGLDVFSNTFDELAAHPGVRARQLGLEGVSETCRTCTVVESCGGGLYSHRYSPERQFNNPSVYCADLQVFIDGVAERITQRTLTPAVFDTDELRFSQVDVNRGLTALVYENYAHEPAIAEGWRVLVALDADAGAAAHLNTLLAHPYIRTSLQWCLDLDGFIDMDRFVAIAAAAAIQAGIDTTIAWESRSADLHLPTLGTLQLGHAGHVEMSTSAEGFRVRSGDVSVHVRWGGSEGEGPERWRPLHGLESSAGRLLVDDADPYRVCYAGSVTPPLDTSEVHLFLKRWHAACELLDARVEGWRDDSAALAVTTLTPLAAGAGVQLGSHAVGALGISLDVEADDLARGLLRAGRQARLLALRESADLCLAGSRAGGLLDTASAELGEAGYWLAGGPGARARGRALALARGALEDIARLPERELTESGAALVAQLWTEWKSKNG